MKEYVEREAAISDEMCEGISCQECPFLIHPVNGGCKVVKYINSIPAADVVEVRHGEWIATDKYMVDQCSNCQFEMDWDDIPLWLVEMPHFNTCPNCGARMDGGGPQ